MRVSHQQLDELGDPHAEPGSRPWAIALRLELLQKRHDQQWNEQMLRNALGAMEREAGYRHLQGEDGQAFATFEAFCTARPPFGLGYAAGTIDQIITERRSAQAHAHKTTEIGKRGRPKADGKGSDTMFSGRGAAYLTARIARDRPDLLEAMKQGRYPSVRAAAREAGLVKDRWSIPAGSAQAIAEYLARRLSADELRLLIAALEERAACPG